MRALRAFGRGAVLSADPPYAVLWKSVRPNRAAPSYISGNRLVYRYVVARFGVTQTEIVDAQTGRLIVMYASGPLIAPTQRVR